MGSSVPFTVYDFFGYLSSGSALVALVDYSFGYQWLMKEKLPPAQWFLLLMLAYVVGHAVAHVSSLVLENILVVRVLGRPSDTLLEQVTERPIVQRLFGGYYRALPKETRERVRAQATSRGFFGSGESLFLHALPLVTRDDKSQKRLDEFRNLYGFARNMAFTLTVTATGLLVTAISQQNGSLMPLVEFSVVLAVTMLYRYLKFYRQYCYQLFVTYAELGELTKASVALGAAL
jgi:hypothetical protein